MKVNTKRSIKRKRHERNLSLKRALKHLQEAYGLTIVETGRNPWTFAVKVNPIEA